MKELLRDHLAVVSLPVPFLNFFCQSFLCLCSLILLGLVLEVSQELFETDGGSNVAKLVGAEAFRVGRSAATSAVGAVLAAMTFFWETEVDVKVTYNVWNGGIGSMVGGWLHFFLLELAKEHSTGGLVPGMTEGGVLKRSRGSSLAVSKASHVASNTTGWWALRDKAVGSNKREQEQSEPQPEGKGVQSETVLAEDGREGGSKMVESQKGGVGDD